jgi:hypothetical protein
MAALLSGPAGPAIVVVSPDESSRVRVKIDRAIVGAGPPGLGRLHRLDGSTMAAEDDSLEVELEVNEAAIWYP